MGTMELDAIVERCADATPGSAFFEDAIARWEIWPGAQRARFTLILREREEAIVAEVLAGNVPGFCRTFHEIPLTHLEPEHTASVWVAADYLAIGSDEDFVRVPLSPISATVLADQIGCVLPTKRIVDAIYAAEGTEKLPAIVMPPPGPEMTSLRRAKGHNDRIEAARTSALGELVAGHKKDVVVASRLAEKPDWVAIYGFFEGGSGRPIQSLQLPHPDWYSDYSHGIRLVRDVMMVDGEERLVDDVLQDPVLYRLLADPVVDSGPYAVTRYPVREIPEEVSP